MKPEDIPQRTAEAASAVTYLVRGFGENPEAENPLPDFLESLSGELWPAAIAAALETPQNLDGQAYRMVDEAIAAALRDGAHPDIVMKLYDRLPRDTVALRETALELARQLVLMTEQRQDLVERHPADYLRFQNNYVGRLLQMERIDKAEEEAAKAVDFANLPNHAGRADVAPERASALEHQSHVLRATNRPSEALVAMDKAREIYEELCRERPEFKPSLAICLNNYIALLTPLKRPEDAVRFGRQAAALFRELVADRPLTGGEFDKTGLEAWIKNIWPNLAICLIALSSALQKIGEHEESLGAIAEAVRILSLLANESHEFTPWLAQAQSNHAMALEALHRYEEALGAVSAAVETFRKLEGLRPGAFTFYLAHVLRRQSLVLAKLGRLAEAVDPCREAARLYGELEKQRPESVRAELAGTEEQLETILSMLADAEASGQAGAPA